jgi:uncharacterized protein (TIGR00730 family)
VPDISPSASAAALAAAVEDVLPLLTRADERATGRPPRPGAWCAREVLGHLIDSACANHRRFVIGPLPTTTHFDGYAQDVWVARQHYRDESWTDLVALWVAYNRHLVHVMRCTSVEEAARTARAPDGRGPVSVGFLMHDYVQHLRGHLDQIRVALPVTMTRRLCVFCGSSVGARPAYEAAATSLAHCLVRLQIGVVYGGGNVGLMGRLADAVLEAGGEVIGVIPRSLVEKEVCHRGLSDLRIVGSMHERKALMANLSDGFIALPGGYGTLEEFCEVLTWTQLGLHRKPCGLLNVDGYYDSLLALFDHATAERFVTSTHRHMVIAATDPELLVDQLLKIDVPVVEKWIDGSQA